MAETASQLKWRVGRKVGRTIYAQVGDDPSDDDQLIGVMDSPLLAGQVCLAHNDWLHRLALLEDVLNVPFGEPYSERG